jgi:hypothetical protein
MRIKVQLDREDIVALNLHYLSKCNEGRKMMKMYRYAFLLAFILLALLALIKREPYHWLAMPVLAIIAILFPYLWKFFLKRSILENKSIDKLGGEYEYEIREEGLFSKGNSESLFYWDTIRKLETTEMYTFVSIEPNTIMLIPKEKIIEGNYEAFMSKLDEMLKKRVKSPD